MRVTGRENACPRCGKKFAKNTKFECPFCGTLISKKSERCPSCQFDLSSISDETKTTEVPTIAPAQHGDEVAVIRCPLCGTQADGVSDWCPGCGTSLSKYRRPRPEVLADTQSCHYCGAVIPASLERCPLCKMSLIEAVPEVAPPPPPEVPPVAERSGELVAEHGKVAPQQPRPMKQRKLRSAKITTVPPTLQTAPRGRTNGLGQTNGLGRVNGTGAVNGRAFVNGTGVPSGTGARPTRERAKRTSFLTRWQLFTVVVAIIIIVPALIFLTSSNQGKFSVDGDFDDWSEATIFGTRIHSSSATSDIIEWSVATESSELFLYIKTQGQMMSSHDAESFLLFVDSDGSNATGYVTGSIGADYLLKLTGWDAAVISASLFAHSSADRYDWSSWTSAGSLSYRLDGARIEASATMPTTIAQTAKFVLVSKDAAERGSVGYTAPLIGGGLVVRQSPVDDVAATGIVPRAASTAILTLRFTCEGEGGQVSQVNLKIVGAIQKALVNPFALEKGQEKVVTVEVETSAAANGQFVSAEVFASGIVSTFGNVEIIGSGAKAYVVSPGPTIAIDGAFADWTGRLSVDQDQSPVTNPCLDIDKVGNVSTSQDSFFYVGVLGELCSGTFVPSMIAKPSGTGGGVVTPQRHTAEDSLTIYVDSDRDNSTGSTVKLDSMQIGADQKIEVKGLFGRITATKEFDYSDPTAKWIESSGRVDAAKDEKRVEIRVSAVSLGGSTDIEFIVETTSWKGLSDLARFDPSSMSASTRTWIVDPAVTSPYATSMSYQRKMFYDGVSFWSFFFDGANTVHKYSTDDGQTWVHRGQVFSTTGVNDTSIWYDSSTSTVYAVGDTAIPSDSVVVQTGKLDPAAHMISWSTSDSKVNVSRFPLAAKNTYISKDANGYLWLLSSNLIQLAPEAYQLSAFVSSAANDSSSWAFSGNMLVLASAVDNVKGSIVPAGKGSNVWAVYAYAGNVVARKYDGAWQAPQTVYAQAGSKANTDNSPPSVVVDGKGVVHVVYGTGRRAGPNSAPTIEYSHNNTGLTTFTAGVNLDPLIPNGVGDYYPTISLETSTGNLYALWLRSDASLVPMTVVGRKSVSGAWSEFTITPQTIFAKLFLTSVYSVSGEFKVCWQWTQNATAPIDVMFDGTVVPEFGDLALPIIGLAVLFVISNRRSRHKSKRRG